MLAKEIKVQGDYVILFFDIPLGDLNGGWEVGYDIMEKPFEAMCKQRIAWCVGTSRVLGPTLDRG